MLPGYSLSFLNNSYIILKALLTA